MVYIATTVFKINILLAASVHCSASDIMYKREHFKLVKVSVNNYGVINWAPGGQSHSTCPVDVYLYPFDAQKCRLIFANWIYTQDQVNLSYGAQTNAEILDSYQENGEWHVTDISVERRNKVFECCPDDQYPMIIYTIHLRRKTLHYVINLLLPLIILSSMTLIIFNVPLEAGEKLSVGITLLLSYFVFLLMISESLPSTSTTVPLIRKY